MANRYRERDKGGKSRNDWRRYENARVCGKSVQNRENNE